MTTSSNAANEPPHEIQPTASAVMSPTRPLYWSVRCELWESRSIYIAPLAVAAVVLIGFMFSMIGMPERRRAVLLLDLAQQRAAIDKPYDIAAMALLATGVIVGVFYCLDALHGERRDRSILFWKSLPVSDLATVLSKASIPLVVLPAITLVVTLATQLVMLLTMNAVLLVNGVSVTTWEQLPLGEQSIVLLYGLIALALWHAPIYGWLLLVSGWARRSVFLWAVLPVVVIPVVEKIAFNTSYVGSILKHRLTGFAAEAFAFGPHARIDSLAQLTPGRFLSTPGLWIGLAFAAAFLVAAARQRRYRGPI
jgi:ABC-2 type transport system permease protein